MTDYKNEYSKVAVPTLVVYQPNENKLLSRDAKEDLLSWEKRIAEWSGVNISSSDVFSSGGTCTDSGNDCDVD